MNYEKIGKFLMEERKKLNLTQAKLAEKIYVSEKTISKWENGKGVPDANSLTKFCDVFGVGLKELLNGERTAIDSHEQNEKLLLEMAKELEIKNKIIWKAMWVIMAVSLISLIAGCCIVAFLVTEGMWQLISVIILCVVFLIPCFYALKLEVSVGAYMCKNCGAEIIPTYKQALNAMHRGTTRYLKCPDCKKRSWCKKVINKNKK